MSSGDGIDKIAETARQWFRHGWRLPAEMFIVTSAVRVDQLWQTRLENVLAQFGLTVARYEVLALLRFSKRCELPLGKIGERLQVHPTSVTSVIDGLEALKFVQREPHPTDRRRMLAVLTAAGRHTVEAAQERVGEEFGDLGLTPEESYQLAVLFNKVRAHFGDPVDATVFEELELFALKPKTEHAPAETARTSQ